MPKISLVVPSTWEKRSSRCRERQRLPIGLARGPPDHLWVWKMIPGCPWYLWELIAQILLQHLTFITFVFDSNINNTHICSERVIGISPWIRRVGTGILANPGAGAPVLPARKQPRLATEQDLLRALLLPLTNHLAG